MKDGNLTVREARDGDRYMLCSDGLSGVVANDEIARVLADGDPTGSVTRLVDLALERGAPDNVTVVIADVVEVADAQPDVPVIEVVTREDAVVHETNESVVTHETRVVDASGPGLGARVMTEVVAAAASLARTGDTVLLAPAGASFDQFAGYADRGDTFAAAVRAAVR